MTGSVPGLGGTLLPERYVTTQLLADAAGPASTGALREAERQLRRWWPHAEAACGPTSALRALFDIIAMPLTGILGFSARDVTFDDAVCRARLVTARHTAVALLLTTWASRPSSRWAELARHASEIGAGWGMVLAPPFLSVVPTRGHATRRGIDVTLPLVIPSTALAHLVAVAHASAFDPRPTGVCRLDHIVQRAASFQDEVRVDLQEGVETSLRVLEGVVRRSGGRARKGGGSDTAMDASPTGEALTLIYRILFLLFAESRQMVPNDAPIYRDAYAVSRFCRDAIAGASTGLWDGLAATSRLSRRGCQTSGLHVTPFNGALFAKASAPHLERRRGRGPHHRNDDRRDDAVRRTLVALGSRRGNAGLETINYRDLGVEQLGAVYERVLDIDRADVSSSPGRTPPHASQVSAVPAAARRRSRHSHIRLRTGTFYTPQPLATFVVRRTLAPLVDGASSDGILALRVVDPAMGSGAFLVAACRYLAQAYEDALVAEGRLGPEDIDDEERGRMRRLVAERCLSGVDRNSTAVQLARLSLWLTTLSRDKPLSFFDHRLRVGDSLLGAFPGDLTRTSMRRVRAHARLPLFDHDPLGDSALLAVGRIRALVEQPDDSVAAVRAKEVSWRRFLSDHSPVHRWRLAAHFWCARWFCPPGTRPPGDAETRAVIDAIVGTDRTVAESHVHARTRDACAVADARSFFHWPLEFPDVFYEPDGRPRERPGYDAVIGNPPWEMVRQDDGPGGGTRQLTQYVRQSGQYPSCSTGHLNLYQAFVDRSLSLVRPGGRVGLVLPWGVAVDDGSAGLRERLASETRIDTIVGLDNAQGLFPIHRGLRFAVVTTTAGGQTESVRAAFGVRSGDELDRMPSRGGGPSYPVTLTTRELRAAGGAAMRVPDLRRATDLKWLLAINDRFPRLGSVEGWGVSFGRELNATEVGPHLAAEGVRVIEGKHLSPFVVAAGSGAYALPATVERMIGLERIDHPRVGYRDVSGVGNRLTMIAAVIPAKTVTTHTVLCVRNRLDDARQFFLCALLNSYVINAIVRLLMGGHVTTSLAESLPAPVWRGDRADQRIAGLARRLSVSGVTLSAHARLQALVARRFRLSSVELAHVLDGFPLVPAGERAEVMRAFEKTEGTGEPG